MKDALMNGSVYQPIRITPPATYKLTIDELMECEADWGKMRALLIEKGAPKAKLDAGDYTAKEVKGGLQVEIINAG